MLKRLITAILKRPPRVPGVSAQQPELTAFLQRAELARQRGDDCEAEAILREAAASYPPAALALAALAQLLADAGRDDEARAAFERARASGPATCEATLDYAQLLEKLGDTLCAESLYTELIEARPDWALPYAHYGALASVREDWPRALALYGRAAALAPDMLQAQIGLGLAFLRLGRLSEALECYEAALRLDPQDATVLHHLASVHYRLGDGERVKATLEALNRVSPSHGRSIAAALVLPSIMDSREDIERVRWRLANDLERLSRSALSVRDPAAEVDMTAFYLAYQGCDDRELQQRIAALHLKACPALAYVAPHCASASRRNQERLRIGIVSRHLYGHSIGRVMQGLIRRLDRKRFSVHACTFQPPFDDVSRAIARDADEWMTLPRDLSGARETLAHARCDVLLYADIGMDPLTYFLSFARLAPVQCTTWGHPLTTGVPNVDYFISTDYFDPEGAQSHYSERLVRLKDVAFPGYYDRPGPSTARADSAAGFDRGRRVYFCPQALFKLHPDFDDLLAAILRRDAGGETVISHDPETDAYRLRVLQARLRRTAGDVFERIVFLPRTDSREGYVRRLQACDVALDTLHYCGGNTSLDTIMAGAPLVTLPSALNRGRHTYGFFRKMRFVETVAETAEQYVDLAVRIATDRDFRAHVKDLQLSRAEALYEDQSAVDQIGDFFERSVAIASHG